MTSAPPPAPRGSAGGPSSPARLPFRTEPERRANAGHVAVHLRNGGLIAYPTETVYGFGCALLPDALVALQALKGREGNRPFLLLVGEAGELEGVQWTDEARRLASAFWPGPLTLALPARGSGLPGAVLSSDGTVAVRISPHEAVHAILGAFRGPITSTSVNVAGAAPAGDADAAAAVVEAAGASDRVLVLDGGTLPPSPPSTLVDCARRPPRVLRVGALAVAVLRTVIPEIDDPG